MTRAVIAWLWQINEPSPIKYAWVALTLVNVGLMAWLAWRERESMLGWYMGVAAISSLFRASPLWNTAGDFLLAAAACAFGWSLLPKGAPRWFAVSIGVTLLGVLLLAAPMDWPGYSPTRYAARLDAAVLLLAISLACVLDRWTRGEPTDWRSVIAVVWFATWFLTLVQWRDDPQTKAYWVAYWRVALAGKVAACGCLVGWIMAKQFNISRRSA